MFWMVIAHLTGDYFLQSDWMAMEKTKNSWVTLLHVILYTLPFVFITQSIPALLFIASTHFVIDRWRLARYVGWAKNWLAPRGWNKSWAECKGTGYTSDKPVFMAVWLMIITDNTLHLICNALALLLL
jgi:hypothetical protein